MCPFCFAGLAAMAAGAASAGGLAVLAVKLSRKKAPGEETIPDSTGRSNQNVHQRNGTTEGSLAR
jgi:hypothetical protein